MGLQGLSAKASHVSPPVQGQQAVQRRPCFLKHCPAKMILHIKYLTLEMQCGPNRVLITSQIKLATELGGYTVIQHEVGLSLIFHSSVNVNFSLQSLSKTKKLSFCHSRYIKKTKKTC